MRIFTYRKVSVWTAILSLLTVLQLYSSRREIRDLEMKVAGGRVLRNVG